jgi:hypothetical protein
MDNRPVQTKTLLDAVTTTGKSKVFAIPAEDRTIQTFINGSGSVSATVLWYGSNKNSTDNAILIATSSLSGTATDATGIALTSRWPFVFADCTAISGTGAAVTALIGH